MTATGTIAQVNALAAHTALSAWGVAGDFLIVIVLFTVLFLFARYVGRGPFVAFLLAFYSAYALYVVALLYTSFLPTAPAMTVLLAHVGAYVALIFVFFIILRRVIVSDFLYIGVFGLIVLSLLGSAFLIALAYHVFSITDVYSFTPAIDALFAPAKYFFWWFVAPAAGLLFFAR